MLITPHIERLIDMALDEDLAGGDVTTEAIFGPYDHTTGTLLAKQDVVQCGRDLFDAVMHRVDSTIEVEWIFPDGAEVVSGTELATIKGPTASVLMGERVALNFFQRMCGIATKTRRFVEELADSEADIADTRKTLPGFRLLDKVAVRVGGGRNHRMNLGGGVMIKDNHIAAAGSIYNAVDRVRALAPHTVRIEVEVTTMEELEEAVEAAADIIMLDNMSVEEMTACVKRARELSGARPVILEASGNVTLETVAAIGKTGVDIISSGALTHSVKAADISLNLQSET